MATVKRNNWNLDNRYISQINICEQILLVLVFINALSLYKKQENFGLLFFSTKNTILGATGVAQFAILPWEFLRQLEKNKAI